MLNKTMVIFWRHHNTWKIYI